MVKRAILLALGSDAGNRRRILARAVAELRRLPGVKVREVSEACESTEVRSRRGKPFLTAAVRCVSDRTAMGLLIELKRIEALLGCAIEIC
jgi:7,8-dihydro-6-hydroxymethylpterin-pyrophosphokinase